MKMLYSYCGPAKHLLESIKVSELLLQIQKLETENEVLKAQLEMLA